MSIETVVYRLKNDPGFARAMVQDPATALAEAGLELDPDELLALTAAIQGSDVISGATDDPTEWFAPQFNGVTEDPTEWFEHQFQADIA